MSIRPADMQQIFSNKDSVEKVQQSIVDKHAQQQQAAAVQQQKQAIANNTKSSKSSEDSSLGFKEKHTDKESLQNKHRNKKEQHEEENGNDGEGGIIDIRV